MQTTFYILYVQKEFVSPGEDDVEEIFYVGRTSVSLRKRLHGHLADARQRCTTKGKYIANLLQQHRTIRIKEIYRINSVEPSKVAEIEDELIEAYRNYGYPLLNQRSGMAGYHVNHQTKVNWTPSIIARLGTVHDNEIAQELGCDVCAVCDKRNSLNIMAYKHSLSSENFWTQERIAKLGTMRDTELARELGRPLNFVSQKRRELGIKKFDELEWSEETLAKMGTMPDTVIAQELGYKSATVTAKRRSLNISAYENFVWTEDILSLLGTMPDATLAEQLKTKEANVGYHRRKLGIPVYREKPSIWTSENIALIGTKPDKEIARLLNLKTKQVAEKRRSLNIPRYEP